MILRRSAAVVLLLIFIASPVLCSHNRHRLPHPIQTIQSSASRTKA